MKIQEFRDKMKTADRNALEKKGSADHSGGINMGKESFTSLRSLLGGLARAMNLINSDVEHHHEQVAFLAFHIARELRFSQEQLMYTICAALLHDIGSIMFEKQCPVEEIEVKAQTVARMGADMLRDIPGMEILSGIIEYCQDSWTEAQTAITQHEECRQGARIAAVIHLADAVTVTIDPNETVLNQVEPILKLASRGKGTEFSEEAVDALLEISKNEYLWFDLLYNPSFLLDFFAGDIRLLTLRQTLELTRVMSRIIDYRSAFTAMHSAGVAASAATLAHLSGMDSDDCMQMWIAGFLHDIGKLKVPTPILEKPGKLTDAEFNVIKEHPYNTRLVLKDIDGFEKIRDWAGFHHEKLNGRGYPFHWSAQNLDQGSLILSVADIFSALTEDRPYRAGMARDKVYQIMREDVASGAISGDIVNLLFDNYGEVDDNRDSVSHEAGKRYYASLARQNRGK